MTPYGRISKIKGVGYWKCGKRDHTWWHEMDTTTSRNNLKQLVKKEIQSEFRNNDGDFMDGADFYIRQHQATQKLYPGWCEDCRCFH